LIIKDQKEAQFLADYILGKVETTLFYDFFKGKYSSSFNPEKDLNRIGVVNQTTMLATETQAIADFLKQTMIDKYGENDLKNHFADNRDTLCYATNENQDATIELLKTEADLAIVVGGYNSSNTSHLVELLEEKFPTYFISSPENISDSEISHFDYASKKLLQIQNFLPNKSKINILITSGASCPDTLLDEVIQKIIDKFQFSKTFDEVLADFQPIS
jgi:4-hydroxy-3-methylbut-2-enyl diphosphate reductase